MIKRIIRLLCIDLYLLSFFGLYRLIFQGGYTSKQAVPVPEWYDDTVDFRNSVIHQFRDFKLEVDERHRSVSDLVNRILGFGAHLRSQYSQGYPPVGEWFQGFEDRRGELFMRWGPVVLTLLMLALVWFVDTFIAHVF